MPSPAPVPVTSPVQSAQSFVASDYENERITQGVRILGRIRTFEQVKIIKPWQFWIQW